MSASASEPISWIHFYDIAASWTADWSWGWSEPLQIIPTKSDQFRKHVRVKGGKVPLSPSHGRIITCNGHRMRVR